MSARLAVLLECAASSFAGADLVVPQVSHILFATAVSLAVHPTTRSLVETENALYSGARRCVREARTSEREGERLLNSAAVLLACRQLVLVALEHRRLREKARCRLLRNPRGQDARASGGSPS